MASSSGKGKKKRWSSLPIVGTTQIGGTVAAKFNWADEVEAHVQTSDFDFDKPVLPTAPRASRDNYIDESAIPEVPPFEAYLSNIPYEMNELELKELFSDYKVVNVRLARDREKPKGFGHIEFEDRSNLIAALTQGQITVRGRVVSVNIPSEARRGGRSVMSRSDMGQRDNQGADRTSTNWRTRTDTSEDKGGYGGRRGDYGGGGFHERTFRRDEGKRDDRDHMFSRHGRDDRDRDRDRYPFFDKGSGRDRGFSKNDDNFRHKDDRYGSHDRDDHRDRRGYGGSRMDRIDRDHRPRDMDSSRFTRRDGPDRSFPPPDRDSRLSEHSKSRSTANSQEDLGGAVGASENRTRKKLELAPRTKPTTESEPVSAPSAIFGGAKPVDTSKREKEIEERIANLKIGGGEAPGADKPKTLPPKGDWDKKSDVGAAPPPAPSGGGSGQPPPPPKSNPWMSRPRATAPSNPVNNGRRTPEDEVHEAPPSVDNRSDDDKKPPRAELNRKPETRRTEERSRGPPPPKGGSTERPPPTRPAKDVEKPPRHREPKKEPEDISRMPKVQEATAPNFAVANKYFALEQTEDGGAD